MNELSSRNANALADAAKVDRIKHAELVGKVDQLERQVAMLAAELQTLRQTVVTSMVSRGHGPTTR